MKRKAIQRALFCCGLLAILLFLFPVKGDMLLILEQNDSHIVADSTGPEFTVPWGNLSIDYVPNDLQFTLSLNVEVTDPDGVDTVIGSYRLDSETVWHNMTLSYTPRDHYPDLYSAFVMNGTFGEGDWGGGTWYFKFYANDSQGNWASSGVWFQSKFGGRLTSSQSPILPEIPYILIARIAVAVAVTAFVVVLVVKYREVR